MAPAQWVSGWRNETNRRMTHRPGYVTSLYEVLERLNSEDELPSLVDEVVTQPWRRGPADWYDAAAVFDVETRMQCGWLALAVVPLGAEPGPDREVGANQEALCRLPAPFSAACHSGPGDDDGWLEWDALIQVVHPMSDDQRLELEFPPSGVPLEIGHTDPDTTVWHLHQQGGLARWPYGHSHLTLLLSTGVYGKPLPMSRPRIISGVPYPAPPAPIDRLAQLVDGGEPRVEW